MEDGTALDLYLSRQSVDMVILDLMLPGEDGLSIGRRLRQQRNLPIIILSARGESSTGSSAWKWVQTTT